MDARKLSRDWLYLAAGLIVVAISRVVLAAAFGVHPADFLSTSWQTLPAQQLNADLFHSIVNLHAQPPLWNLVVGGAAKYCGGDGGCTVGAMHVVQMLATVAIFFTICRTVEILTNSVALALGAAAAFCLAPGVLFYENLIFYSHLTLLCSCVLMLGAVEWFLLRRPYGLVLCGIALSALSLTWTLFHPLLIAGLAACLLATAWATPARRIALAVFFAVVVLAIGPSLKNYLLFDYFINGTWAGLNLAQVAPVEHIDCGFTTFRSQFPASVNSATVFNDLSIIPLSKYCLTLSVHEILTHPLDYLLQRAFALVHSLSTPVTRYLYKPVNWPREDGSHILGLPAPPQIMQGVAMLTLEINALMFSALGALALAAADPRRRQLFAFIAFFVFAFMFAAHALNGDEQERMRYTIVNFLWLGAIAIFETRRSASGVKSSQGDDAWTAAGASKVGPQASSRPSS